LTKLPVRLLILGGSYIALEMAQAFRRLGSEVVVLQQGPQVAEREDPDVASALQAALEADGIDVRLHVEAIRVEARGSDVRLHLGDGTVEGTHLFVATGRKPNTDDLGLDVVGVSLDEKGMVEVDDQLRSSVRGIWAVGDIRGGPAFTHTAYDDFKTVQNQLLGDETRKRRKIVPYAMFTDPELGRVGMSETEAQEAGRNFVVGRHAMKDSGKARELGKTAGFVKVLVDVDTDRILGAAALCVEGAEIVQLFVELMNSGSPAQTMLDAVHIHPTLCEAAKNAVAAAPIERKP
jgi:pyruvate/2-oxoglutarate dehydrogenase complex dihydrolipoamide dehydrogenase (E3) component